VDICWKDSKLTKAVIRSLLGNSCKVRYGNKMIELKSKKGKTYSLDGNLKRLKNSAK